jgi:teichuronic acid exporter
VLQKDSKSFLKSVSVLFTGAFLAQVLSYVLSPIITRQYGPEESAYLGLFLRITTLGAAIATARLEYAFPLEKQNHHAFGIYQFAFRFSIIIGIFSLFILLLFSGFWTNSYSDYLFLISLPLGVFLTAFYNLGSSWSLRKGDFKTISKSSLILSLFSNVLKVILGFINNSFLFLIGATIIGFLIASISFIKDFIQEKKTAILNRKSKRTFSLVSKNSDLYTYNLPHVFIDLARDLLLASIIWNCYGKAEFGAFDHAFKMLKLPVVFIGASIGQVFFKKCTELLHENKLLFPLVLKICLTLFLVSIIPFGIILIYGKVVFEFVFGIEWRESGVLASIMVPWLLMNFLSSPISHLPILLNKQRSFFLFNLIGTLSMLIIVSIPYWNGGYFSFKEILSLLSYTQAFFLIFVLVWLFSIARKK